MIRFSSQERGFILLVKCSAIHTNNIPAPPATPRTCIMSGMRYLIVEPDCQDAIFRDGASYQWSLFNSVSRVPRLLGLREPVMCLVCKSHKNSGSCEASGPRRANLQSSIIRARGMIKCLIIFQRLRVDCLATCYHKYGAADVPPVRLSYGIFHRYT